jgi:hypothetical protein
MKRTQRFSLLPPRGDADERTPNSRLISDGQVTSVHVPGVEILDQFETVDGYLLVTGHDCPFEETFHFILLDQRLRVRSCRSLGSSFSFVPENQVRILQRLAWEDDRHFLAIVTDPIERWRFTIRRRGIPYVHPRLSAKRV